MTESLSNSSSVSRQIYADIRSAFNAYAKNPNKVSTDEEETYTDNGQITRKIFSDIQSTLTEKSKTSEKQETEQTTEEQNTNTASQVQNTQTQEKAEVKTFTLPKNNQTIISELRRNGLHRTMTAYNIAEEYGISYMKAREILDELNKDSNGFIREYNLPANSTVSYKV